VGRSRRRRIDPGRTLVSRGEIWWVERPGSGRRPHLVLTRQEAIHVLNALLAAPTTRTVRGIPTEVRLGLEDGMPEEWFRNLVVVIYCDPEKTPDQPSATVVGRHPCLAIHLADAHATIAINFADTEQTTDSPVGRITVGPRSVRLAH